MNPKEIDRKRKAFRQDSTVIAENVFVDEATEDRDKTETVERLVEGQLAIDVRKRVGAPDDAPVSIVEVAQQYWLSDMTSSTDYNMTVKCNGVEKTFQTYSASENFRKLVEWLDSETN